MEGQSPLDPFPPGRQAGFGPIALVLTYQGQYKVVAYLPKALCILWIKFIPAVMPLGPVELQQGWT